MLTKDKFNQALSILEALGFKRLRDTPLADRLFYIFDKVNPFSSRITQVPSMRRNSSRALERLSATVKMPLIVRLLWWRYLQGLRQRWRQHHFSQGVHAIHWGKLEGSFQVAFRGCLIEELWSEDQGYWKLECFQDIYLERKIISNFQYDCRRCRCNSSII